MLRRLRRHLTLLCALITGAILCGMALFMLRSSERQLIQSSWITLEGNVNAIVYRLRSEQVLDWDWLSQTEAAERLIIHISESGHPLHYPGSWQPLSGRERLIALGQEKAATLGALRTGEDAFMEPEEVRTTIFELWGDMGERYLCASVYIPMNRSYRELLLLRDMRALDGQIVSQRLLYAGLVGASVLLLALFGWWFSGHALRPVAESQRRQSEFIAAASHELRTPLAVIGTSAEALEYETTPRGKPFAGAIVRECRSAARLVDELLTLAGADSKGLTLQKGPVEPEELLKSAAATFRPLAERRGQQMRCLLHLSPLPVLCGDEARLMQALGIFLDNAVSYTPEGGVITLSAQKAPHAVLLIVSDNGPGISDEHKPHVFERFYRADPARSKKEHYGLGMSIAKEIVRLHGGQIELDDTPGGGLTVTIRLPLG